MFRAIFLWFGETGPKETQLKIGDANKVLQKISRYGEGENNIRQQQKNRGLIRITYNRSHKTDLESSKKNTPEDEQNKPSETTSVKENTKSKEKSKGYK